MGNEKNLDRAGIGKCQELGAQRISRGGEGGLHQGLSIAFKNPALLAVAEKAEAKGNTAEVKRLLGFPNFQYGKGGKRAMWVAVKVQEAIRRKKGFLSGINCLKKDAERW